MAEIIATIRVVSVDACLNLAVRDYRVDNRIVEKRRLVGGDEGWHELPCEPREFASAGIDAIYIAGGFMFETKDCNAHLWRMYDQHRLVDLEVHFIHRTARIAARGEFYCSGYDFGGLNDGAPWQLCFTAAPMSRIAFK